MPMTQERFEGMIRRLETYAAKHPGAYRLRVGLLAALGYAYVLLMLALVVGLTLGVIVLMFKYGVRGGAIKIVVALVILGAMIARSLWVRIPPPEGFEVAREGAPRLFAMVDELVAGLRAPQPHHVLIDPEFNAAASQVPRLGVLGWHANYLLLGLPLMQALSPEELRSVVAHELGHLSGRHGRFGVWIYRVGETWERLLQELRGEGHWGGFLFERFFGWYSPYFAAYSFALRRANEYEADRFAAQLAGAQASAGALVKTEVVGAYLSNVFWPAVKERVGREPEPPQAIFALMSDGARQAGRHADAEGWLAEALAGETGYDDTHPSLTDRLASLGFAPREVEGKRVLPAGVDPPAAPAVTAAQEFLGELADKLEAAMSEGWHSSMAGDWRERYQYAQESQEKLAELDAKAQQGPLSDEEAWDRARWTAEFRNNEQAVPLLREMVQTQPQHTEAGFLLGRTLLEMGDAEGIGHIERVMEREPEAVLPGTELIHAFLAKHGDEEEGERYWKQQSQERLKGLVDAQAERAGVSASDSFLPHGLPAESVTAIRRHLMGNERVEMAFLVRKAVKHFADRPFCILGIVPHTAWHKLQAEDADSKLADQVIAGLQLPVEGMVVVLSGANKNLRKPMESVPGSCIYRRG